MASGEQTQTDHAAAGEQRWPTLVAATLVGLEGAGLFGVGVFLFVESLVSTASEEAGALILAVMAAGLGIGFGVCAVAVLRRLPWVRGPVITWQLVMGGVSMRVAAGVSWLVGVPLIAVALAVLVLLAGPWVIAPRTPDEYR